MNDWTPFDFAALEQRRTEQWIQILRSLSRTQVLIAAVDEVLALTKKTPEPEKKN